MNLNPEKLDVRKLTEEDLSAFHSLVNIFNRVFEEAEPGVSSDTNLLQLLSNHDFVAIAALDENEVVGGLTAYELPMYSSERSELFLYDLAVKPEYQRMGIGKSLIRTLKDYCTSQGIDVFFVLAHEEDGQAIEFYRSTGGKSEKVINFLYEAAVTNT
jgi:aminoglycoside 3-N-acetyltransferase I